MSAVTRAAVIGAILAVLVVLATLAGFPDGDGDGCTGPSLQAAEACP